MAPSVLQGVSTCAPRQVCIPILNKQIKRARRKVKNKRGRFIQWGHIGKRNKAIQQTLQAHLCGPEMRSKFKQRAKHTHMQATLVKMWSLSTLIHHCLDFSFILLCQNYVNLFSEDKFPLWLPPFLSATRVLGKLPFV